MSKVVRESGLSPPLSLSLSLSLSLPLSLFLSLSHQTAWAVSLLNVLERAQPLILKFSISLILIACVLLYVYYYCIAWVHCFIILLNGCTTISLLTVNIVLYCVLRYIISLSEIDINQWLSLLSYVFMLTLYCFSISSVYLYLYICHVIINIIDVMLCISKTVNCKFCVHLPHSSARA